MRDAAHNPVRRTGRLRQVAVATIVVFLRILLVGLVVPIVLPARETPLGYRCSRSLAQVAKAVETYADADDGYWPFDERGPLHSLALLYPVFLDNPHVFVCDVAAESWRVRRQVPRFPPDTALAGAPCYYGFTLHVPKAPPSDFAFACCMPENHPRRAGSSTYVLYVNGHIKWAPLPFCSHDAHDNVFAQEPGWQSDTDCWIQHR